MMGSTSSPAAPFPAWLQAHLEKRGLWNADGIRRQARVRPCHRCGRRVIVGLDADRCAGTARVDPGPLSDRGEAAALILGLKTYSLHWNSLKGTLEIEGPRDEIELRHSPAGRYSGLLSAYDVVAAHRCDVLSLPTIPSVYSRPRVRDYSGEPDY